MVSGLPATDLPRFVRELAAFVELGDEDLATVRRTAPLVLAHEATLSSALYDHFLRFPASARFFLGDDGAPDAARLGRRKHSLGRWLRATAEAALDTESVYGLLSIGLAHSHRAPPVGAVPPHLVVGAMSLTQTALARILGAELPDPAAVQAASIAWNKLLNVHLAVLLLGYLPATPA